MLVDGKPDEAGSQQGHRRGVPTRIGASEDHDNAEDPLGWCDSQDEFEFTLDLLLDGLARAAYPASAGHPDGVSPG